MQPNRLVTIFSRGLLTVILCLAMAPSSSARSEGPGVDFGPVFGAPNEKVHFCGASFDLENKGSMGTKDIFGNCDGFPEVDC